MKSACMSGDPRLRAHVLLVLVLAVVGVLAVVEYLNFTGYCYSQKRYLTDEELIDFAIPQVIGFANLVTSEVQNRLTYNSVEDFHQHNLNCCGLHKWGHADADDGIWVRAVGWYISVAEISFRLSDQPSAKYFDATIFFTACGEIKEMRGYVKSYFPEPPPTSPR